MKRDRSNKTSVLRLAAAATALVVLGVGQANGQELTSSLVVTSVEPAGLPQGPQAPLGLREPSRLSPAISMYSLSAADEPEPRRFQKDDLIQIIIRESTDTSIDASIAPEKDNATDMNISALPDLQLDQLLQLRMQQNAFSVNPSVGIDCSQEFSGEGSYERSETMSGRITARVAEVKPNGLIVLEASKFIENDDETLELRLTGLCSPESVRADNTILSTEIHDLRLTKEHTGEMRKSTRKGLLTQIVEFIFNI